MLATTTMLNFVVKKLIWECLVEETKIVGIVNILHLLLWENVWQIGPLKLAIISGFMAFSSADTALKVILCLCFHLSSHPSEAQKSVNWRIFARLRVFSLTIILLTGILFERGFLNQVKAASCRSVSSVFINFFWLEFTQSDSYASKVFLLFTIHVENVFLFIHIYLQHFSSYFSLQFILQFSAKLYIFLL